MDVRTQTYFELAYWTLEELVAQHLGGQPFNALDKWGWAPGAFYRVYADEPLGPIARAAIEHFKNRPVTAVIDRSYWPSPGEVVQYLVELGALEAGVYLVAVP